MRHNNLTGAEAIHPASFYQSADPGAVGAGKDWWDTTASPPTLKRRNATNDAWLTVSTPAGGASGAAGGSLAGTYPNPTIASDVALPGNPTTTTQAAGNNTTRIATTAFARAAASAGVGQPFTIGFALGDGVNAITTTEPVLRFVVDSGTYNITGWTVIGDVSGSTVLKVDTAAYSATPSFAEIMGSQRVTLSAAVAAQATLSSAVAVTAKIFVQVSVVSASTLKSVSVGLSCVRA